MIFKLNDIISILNKYSVNIIYSKNKYHLSGNYEDLVFLKCGINEDRNEAFNKTYREIENFFIENSDFIKLRERDLIG